MIPADIQELIIKAYPDSSFAKSQKLLPQGYQKPVGQVGIVGHDQSPCGFRREVASEKSGARLGLVGHDLSPWTVARAEAAIKRYGIGVELWRNFYRWVDRRDDEGYTTDYLLRCERVLMQVWEAATAVSA